MFSLGKRESTFLGGRANSVLRKNSTNRFKPILDYILDHAQNDERPYLKVNIFGTEFLALLDSGASRTILGGKGWSVLKSMNIPLNTDKQSHCTVANGQRALSIGTCMLPMGIKSRLEVMEVLVIPELPHVLILGADFFRVLAIVPNLRDDEWYFADQHRVDLMNVPKNQTVLTNQQSEQLDLLISKMVSLMGDGLGCTHLVEHVIVTKSQPIKQRYYPVSPVIQKVLDKELDEMLRLGIVEQSKSPWSSPVCLVKKKDGNYRFCVDYRKLNSVTERDSYPLPYVSSTLDKLRSAHYLSSLDIKSAYWQVPVAKDSRPYTAFTVPNRGLFQFCRMPFGLHNAPATWQRLIEQVLGADLEPHVFVYLDDIVIVTETYEKHLEILEEVFTRLIDAGLKVSIEKCQFCRPEMKYLGYVVDRNGLHVDVDKVRAMLELPSPKSVSDLRRILGTFSWYRRFIPDFSSYISPMTALLNKSKRFVWSSECEQSFQKIKQCLVKAPVLSCPDYSLPFVIQTDASGFGLGAVLSQPHPDGERVICYLSRSLTRQERNYSTTERECLAVVWALEKLRPYIEGIHCSVITDHYSLVWLQNQRNLTGRLARWLLRLQQFDFHLIHRKGKENIVPDALSRSVPVLDFIETPICLLSPDIKDKWFSKMFSSVVNNPLKFDTWKVVGSDLYKYARQDYPALQSESDAWKLVVPKEQRHKIISDAHCLPTSGHMGVYKTFHRIREKHYWPRLRADVAKFIRGCGVCIAHKPEQKPPAGHIVSHPKPSQPWETISTDLMGPLPSSKRGYKYILVVTDYLSKFCLVYPLRSASAEIVKRTIEEQVFLLFGVPRILICDNGPQYRSKQFQSMVSSYKCQIKYCPVYHPQANPTERINKNLKTMLSMFVSDNHRDWDVNLSKVACALRTCKHEVAKLSPYFINFGRSMVLSGDDYTNRDALDKDCDERLLGSIRNESMRKLFGDVRQRLQKASQASASRYNLRRRDITLLPNQPVWRKNFVLSDASKYFSSKLAPKYVGPFYVDKKISPWTYQLRDKDGKDKGTWNIKDLKAHPPDENLPLNSSQ